MQATNTRPRFEVTADAHGICSHVGAALLGELSDRLGLTGELGRRANLGLRAGACDRGVVLRDLVVMLADGGDCVSDLATLRDQPELFGAVCSVPTAWRVLTEELPADRRGTAALWSALVRVRERAWALGAAPAGPPRIDLDATLVEAHSQKRGAAPTYKHGFGFRISGKVTEGGPHGYDGAKKVGGRKRHLLVDTLGLLLTCASPAPTSATATVRSALLRRLDRRQAPLLRQDYEVCRPPPRRSFHLAVLVRDNRQPVPSAVAPLSAGTGSSRKFASLGERHPADSGPTVAEPFFDDTERIAADSVVPCLVGVEADQASVDGLLTCWARDRHQPVAQSLEGPPSIADSVGVKGLGVLGGWTALPRRPPRPRSQLRSSPAWPVVARPCGATA